MPIDLGRRPRPYIPLSIRIQVIERQLAREGWSTWLACLSVKTEQDRLQALLKFYFGDIPYNLDHDPALINRDYNPTTRQYSPTANDPNFLIYRSAQDHRTKTFVRGEHGQHSDMGLRRKAKRIARKASGKPRTWIPQRKNPWPA